MADSLQATVDRAKAVLAQTKAQGSTPFAGSSYDTGASTTKNTPSGSTLDQLISSTGGHAVKRSINGKDVDAVEYTVRGPNSKSTRYAYPGQAADMDAPGTGTVESTVGPDPLQEGAPEVPMLPTAAVGNSGLITDPLTKNQYQMGPGGTYVPVGGTNASQTGQGSNSPYQAAYDAAQASGVAAPSSPGEARGQVGGFMPQQNQMSMGQAVVQSDPFFSQIQQQFQDYFSPKNQRESLTQTYTKLSKQMGIEKLDTELMDMKNVIDGSEDDIRNEITKAGGFATESQVQALTNSRNKQLVKNYNTLLETRNTKSQYLDKMIGLEAQDRQAADAHTDRMMNFAFQMADYGQKMKQNAVDSYVRTANAVGYDGLLKMTAGNAYYKGLIEQTLGMPPGGLDIAAQRSAQDRSLAVEKEQLGIQALKSNLATDAMQRANISSEIAARNKPEAGEATLNGKPQTQAQLNANGYADRMIQAEQTISNLGGKFTGAINSITSHLPNLLKSGDRQVYEQSQRNFINAALRQESGAVIGPSEFQSAAQQYFPQPGDNASTITQKAANRAVTINNLYREANIPSPDIYVITN